MVRAAGRKTLVTDSVFKGATPGELRKEPLLKVKGSTRAKKLGKNHSRFDRLERN